MIGPTPAAGSLLAALLQSHYMRWSSFALSGGRGQTISTTTEPWGLFCPDVKGLFLDHNDTVMEVLTELGDESRLPSPGCSCSSAAVAQGVSKCP